jgi:Zn-dependent protease with chaperone function
MTAKRIRSRIALGILMVLMALPTGVAFAQTKIKPGFNLFSVSQDVEIGRQSAAEVESQLPILTDRSIEAYVNAVGNRLAVVTPGADFPYQFKVVNASDINAFALPGGYLYLNRGLIEAAKQEGQLAGVMAHEMAHVALRHGTNQASKAYLGQAGLGVLGGLTSGKSDSTQKAIGAVGGFGMNTLFLKFSRTDEEQADIVGAQMMAKAGYDPKDMVDFFEMLRSQASRNPSKVEQFFSSHPAPKDRAARIRKEMKMLTIRPTQPVGGFQQARAELLGLPKAPSMQQIAQGTKTTPAVSQARIGGGGVVETSIDRPSSTFRSFEQRGQFFQMDYPENWRVYEPSNGYGVTIAPDGGYVDTGGEERNLIYGVIVNHYDTFDSDASERFINSGGSVGTSNSFVDNSGRIESRTNLATATNDIVSQIVRTNRHLKLVPNSQRTDTISGALALSLVLSGTSPVTRQEERVTVFTRELTDDDVIYALFIAPGQDYDELRKTFDRMISSLDVNDAAAHR